MPKNKTHKGASKRFKVTGTGKLLHAGSGMRHHLEVKPSKLTRRLNGDRAVSAADAPRIKKLLGR
jgi:large subunit ribosomal protein L35